MNKIEQIRFELKESLLWQALNNRLLNLKNQGISIQDADHQYLQKFCFDNDLFSTVTAPIIYEDIPFSLITDFKGLCFVSIEHQAWNSAIHESLPGVVTLSIDKARADAFEALSIYDRKYQFFLEDKAQEDDSDDDAELYAFIDECEDMRNPADDFAEIVFKAYDAKADFIKHVLETYKSVKTKTKDDTVVLDIADKDEIISAYRNMFCATVLAFLPTGSRSPSELLRQWKLHSHLHTARDDAGAKQSIKNFCEHELKAFEQENQIIEKFRSELTQSMQTKNINTIYLCNTTPFYFLSNPFPVV
ncbi:hypothetical protein [Desulfosudis oleivorans]|uniref:Uncharacterized protein n=1 Tax=Desulfosudis oleivorans (strain DSM 6200 / JCM 39069 / Hxd3) TaxID=96561 RepID=A8ZYI6_DESOH|nr:hypothetical protein [Desulfosudis oleivorans]ABW68711.1 hypothetical protein Dole_2908 [Desulfosudis oleivorans Hxd3]